MFWAFSVCSVLSVCSLISLNLILRYPRLKAHPQAELPLPHLGQAGDGCDLPRVRGVHSGDRLSQVDVIEGVVEFSPKLSSDSFSDPEVLAQGRIVVEEPRPEERIARHRSEGSRRRSLPRATRAAVRIQYCGCCGCCGAALPGGNQAFALGFDTLASPTRFGRFGPVSASLPKLV